MKSGAEKGSILRKLFGLTLPGDDTEDRRPEPARRSGEHDGPQGWGNDDPALERRYEVAAKSVENGTERSKHEMGSYRRPRPCEPRAPRHIYRPGSPGFGEPSREPPNDPGSPGWAGLLHRVALGGKDGAEAAEVVACGNEGHHHGQPDEPLVEPPRADDDVGYENRHADGEELDGGL